MSDAVPKRLSALEQIVLLLLDNAVSAPLYGYAMVEASGGRLKMGTIYVTLGRMEKKGLIKSFKEERRPGAVGLPRRQYEATADGRRAFQEWQISQHNEFNNVKKIRT